MVKKYLFFFFSFILISGMLVLNTQASFLGTSQLLQFTIGDFLSQGLDYFTHLFFQMGFYIVLSALLTCILVPTYLVVTYSFKEVYSTNLDILKIIFVLLGIIAQLYTLSLLNAQPSLQDILYSEGKLLFSNTISATVFFLFTISNLIIFSLHLSTEASEHSVYSFSLNLFASLSFLILVLLPVHYGKRPVKFREVTEIIFQKHHTKSNSAKKENCPRRFEKSKNNLWFVGQDSNSYILYSRGCRKIYLVPRSKIQYLELGKKKLVFPRH